MESASNKAAPGQRKSKKSKWKKTTFEFGSSANSNLPETPEIIIITEKNNNPLNDILPTNKSENVINQRQVSEKVKAEVDRCLNIAKKYLEKREFDRALIFSNKALQLNPSPESLSLLNEIQEKKEEIIKKLLEDETEKLKKKKIIEVNENLCKQIINSSSINEVLGVDESTSDEDTIRTIKNFLRILHPDKNLAPSAQEATQILISLKDRLEKKQETTDNLGNEEHKEEETILKKDEKPEESDISDDSYNSDEDIDNKTENTQRIPKRTHFRRASIIKDETQTSENIPYEEDGNAYEELEEYILQFSNIEFFRNPTSEEIPNEFIDVDDYIAKLKAAYFVELHEIILKAINGVFSGKEYFVTFVLNDDFFMLSPECSRSTKEEFSLEIQANDLLFICDVENYSFIENHYDLKQSSFNLGIVKKNPNDNVVKIISLLEDDSNIQYCVISIGNLTTLRREFLAFTKIKDALLLDHILSPKLPNICNPIVSQKFLNVIKKNFNQGQYEALLNAFSLKEGIILIQGPPGTGKTATIMGLISGYWSSNSETKPKILVCAPSNAAIDEIASRANNNKIFDENGNPVCRISLLRIGQKRFKNELGIIEDINVKDIPTNVKEISLNYLSEKDLNEGGLYDQAQNIKNKLKKEQKLAERLEKMMKKGNADIKKFEELVKKREEVLEDIDYLKEEQQDYRENRKISRKELIQAADVIFCTTSTAGSADMLSAFQSSKNRIAPRRFDYLIIDEACQCIELNMLIPFLYDTPTVILFGDHKQLPATTFSETSKVNKYNRSLFERFIDCGISPQILKVQYRMSKELCQYPSMYFYDHLLKSHPSVDLRQAPLGIRPLGLLFINLTRSQEISDQHDYSYYNEIEAKYIVKKIIGENVTNLGIITPYRKQVECLTKLLDEKFEGDWRDRIEVDSVDGYQGREKDFIILSLVRSNLATGNIGFLKDIRRMNVAITRAKFGLHIVGNALCLKKNDDWDNFIEFCDSKNKLIHSDYDGKQSFWNQLELEKKISIDRNHKGIEFNISGENQFLKKGYHNVKENSKSPRGNSGKRK